MESSTISPGITSDFSNNLSDDPETRGKRVGVLVVTYNAVKTISKVLKRIPDAVWKNVEEVVIFDDASEDATFALAVGLKALSENTKLQVLRQAGTWGMAGTKKPGTATLSRKASMPSFCCTAMGNMRRKFWHASTVPLRRGRRTRFSGRA